VSECLQNLCTQSTSGSVTTTTDPTYEKTGVGQVSAFEHTSLISVLGTFSNFFTWHMPACRYTTATLGRNPK